MQKQDNDEAQEHYCYYSSSRCLWKNPPPLATNTTTTNENRNNNNNINNSNKTNREKERETYDSILREFSIYPTTSKPRHNNNASFTTLCCNTLVVGQEFALTCLFLARHRVIIWEEEEVIKQQQQQSSSSSSSSTITSLSLQKLQQRVNQSQILSLLALILIAIYTNSSSSPPQIQSRRVKVKQRTYDAILLAILLRILSSVLQTLTASYSTDTVERLAITGMIIHWFTCDYSYANGTKQQQQQQQQPLQKQSATNTNTHTTTTPTTTTISMSSPHSSSSSSSSTSSSSKRPVFQGGTISLNAAFFSTTLLASRLSSNATVYIFVSSAIILFAFFPASRHAISQHPKKVMDRWECMCFTGILVTICGLAPLWKFLLQRYKRKISGPWDVVSVPEMKLYWTPSP